MVLMDVFFRNSTNTYKILKHISWSTPFGAPENTYIYIKTEIVEHNIYIYFYFIYIYITICKMHASRTCTTSFYI